MYKRQEYCTVKNVLPGQKLSVMITKVRKGKGEGRVLEVLEQAPDEVEAPCPHFGSCGGCTYQMCIRDRDWAVTEKGSWA